MRSWLAPVVLACMSLTDVGCVSSSPASGAAVATVPPVAAPSVDRDLALAATASLPAAGGCDEVSSFDDDPRCPDAVLHAATLSWLGKVAAEVTEDGVHMLEYDPAELRAEASEDAAYRAMLLACDRDPSDGLLSRTEALDFEARVLATLDREALDAATGSDR